MNQESLGHSQQRQKLRQAGVERPLDLHAEENAALLDCFFLLLRSHVFTLIPNGLKTHEVLVFSRLLWKQYYCCTAEEQRLG